MNKQNNSVEINLEEFSKEELMLLIKKANENDMTINQCFSFLLETYINDVIMNKQGRCSSTEEQCPSKTSVADSNSASDTTIF